ncbi:MAG TPA: AbrB/MazE/SpoVT family DNA-binding domain-containing protein [Gaiellaceae bacterium]
MAGRVTTKGQITIPLEIRDRLGIQPGSVVDFEVEDDAVVVRKRRDGAGRGSALVSRLRGAATTQLSTDEIMRLTRA